MAETARDSSKESGLPGENGGNKIRSTYVRFMVGLGTGLESFWEVEGDGNDGFFRGGMYVYIACFTYLNAYVVMTRFAQVDCGGDPRISH